MTNRQGFGSILSEPAQEFRRITQAASGFIGWLSYHNKGCKFLLRSLFVLPGLSAIGHIGGLGRMSMTHSSAHAATTPNGLPLGINWGNSLFRIVCQFIIRKAQREYFPKNRISNFQASNQIKLISSKSLKGSHKPERKKNENNVR